MKKKMLAPNFIFTFPIVFSSSPRSQTSVLGDIDNSSVHRPLVQSCMRDVGYGFTPQST